MEKHIPKNWKLLIDENDIKNIVKNVAIKINDKFRNSDKETIIVCILKGGIYFYVDLTRELDFPHMIYFIEASSYKNGKKSENLKIIKPIEETKLKDKNIILVDELYDTGNTLSGIINYMVLKCNINKDNIYTCTLFVKDKETAKGMPDIYGKIIPNKWIIGYGLDHCSKYRNLKGLYECK